MNDHGLTKGESFLDRTRCPVPEEKPIDFFWPILIAIGIGIIFCAGMYMVFRTPPVHAESSFAYAPQIINEKKAKADMQEYCEGYRKDMHDLSEKPAKVMTALCSKYGF